MTTMLAQRIPVTLQPTVASLVVALVIAAPLGIVSALRPRSWIARGVTGYNALAMAVPTFWLGILLVLCFGLWLRWLPTSGFVPVWQEPWRALRFMILPAFTLGAYVSAVLARFTRAALLETLYQDYVRTARAKGLSDVEVGRIAVLATERPAFTFDPALYRSVGLEPRDAKIVVVKSPLQSPDGYGDIARACWVVDTPGPSTVRVERLEWRHRSRPLFPFDDGFEPEIRAVTGADRGGGERSR